ncbi:putative 22.7 kDa secreted protein [Ixodes scapularis]
MYLYSIALATFLVGTSQHFGLSSTVSPTDLPYEDDPKNFEHQHATGFLCSNSTYYMLNRTYTPQPPSECVSVNVTSGLRNGTYQALLRHRFNGSSEILNITVHPFTSEPHTEDNALLFNISMKPNVVAEAGTAPAGVGSSERAESGFRGKQSEPASDQQPRMLCTWINSRGGACASPREALSMAQRPGRRETVAGLCTAAGRRASLGSLRRGYPGFGRIRYV